MLINVNFKATHYYHVIECNLHGLQINKNDKNRGPPEISAAQFPCALWRLLGNLSKTL